jgi:drug/metabolite transporter (DMT)-like permease
VEPTSSSTLYPRILKGGAVVFVLLGTGLIAWLADQWVKHPEVQASQFGNTAPFWPAVIVFVLISMAAGVALLWRAASRLEDGENLFEERHRKHLKDFEDEES